MLQALVNGVLCPPQKNLKGKCQFCGDDMIPKCGSLKMHHWAHKIKECDDWQTGKETEWHINWKKTIGLDFAEKRIIKNDQFHIADILIPNSEGKIDLIVEFQNSPLSQIEIHERETFYGERLIWILNGTQLGEKFTLGRNFGYNYYNRWIFEPIIDHYFYDYKTGETVKGYVVSVPSFLYNKDYEKFLSTEGYVKSPDSKNIVALRTSLGLKDKGNIDSIYYFKPIPDPDWNTWVKDRGEFILKRDAQYNMLKMEHLNRLSPNDIVDNVYYQWKFARKDFNIAKRPIYIDLDDNYVFKLQNGYTRKGYGKLIRKPHFINSIVKKTKYSQLSLKLN